MNREDSCPSEFLKYLWQIPLPCWVTFPAIQGRRCKWLLLLHPSMDRCQHMPWKVSRTENAVWIKSELQLLQANVPFNGKCWRKPREQTMPPFIQHKTPSLSRMQSRQVNAHCMEMVLPPPHSSPGFCGTVADLRYGPCNQNQAQEQLEELTSQGCLSPTSFFVPPCK